MPTIAPWLRGPDVLGAMQSGAQAGISLRGQDLEDAYRQQQLEAQRAQAAATLAMSQRQMDDLTRYRQQQVGIAQKRLEQQSNIAQTRTESTAQTAADKLALEQSKLDRGMTDAQRESLDLRKAAQERADRTAEINALREDLKSSEMLTASLLVNEDDKKLTPGERMQRDTYLASRQRLNALLKTDLQGAQTTGTKTGAPTSKSDLANQLAQQHPDWSRSKIISEVNRQMP